MAQAQTSQVNFGEILKAVAREKDIEMDRWVAALEDAMASAAKTALASWRTSMIRRPSPESAK